MGNPIDFNFNLDDADSDLNLDFSGAAGGLDFNLDFSEEKEEEEKEEPKEEAKAEPEEEKEEPEEEKEEPATQPTEYFEQPTEEVIEESDADEDSADDVDDVDSVDDVMDLLIDSGGPLEISKDELISSAEVQERIEADKQLEQTLLDSGVDINLLNFYKSRALNVATVAEQKKQMQTDAIIDSLAENGGDINRKMVFGQPTASNPFEVQLNKKGTYLIVPDFHYWNKNITARCNYVAEMQSYCSELLNILEFTRTDINNVIFAGDIFHQGFSTLDSTASIRSWFRELKKLLNSRGGEIYSVIGNHEYTYHSNNLFWHLVRDDVIKTPTDIYDSGVHIALDSYPSKRACREFRKKIDADICITHTEVLPPQIKKEEEKERQSSIFTSSKCLSFERFNVKNLFIGHLHKIVQTYVVQEDGSTDRMTVQYLGSIGRTNISEVRNDFLDRKLPIIKVLDNSSYEVEQLPFQLQSYEASVISMVAAQNKAAYEAQKAFTEYKLAAIVEDPIDAILSEMQLSESLSEILLSAADREPSTIVENVVNEVKEVLNKYKI